MEAGAAKFFCYLLSSVTPRFPNATYIGFTVNPRRRLRQHNREIKGGAWRTGFRGPWRMALVLAGFPDKRTALQFEWHCEWGCGTASGQGCCMHV
jgi:structure-specific endonuclease subunit SLX1